MTGTKSPVKISNTSLIPFTPALSSTGGAVGQSEVQVQVGVQYSEDGVWYKHRALWDGSLAVLRVTGVVYRSVQAQKESNEYTTARKQKRMNGMCE